MLNNSSYLANSNKTYTFTHPKLKVEYMENKDVTADNYGITFNLPHTHKYTVRWWQIEQDGFTKWHDHLREKSWFTDAASRKFIDLCIEHFNWN